MSELRHEPKQPRSRKTVEDIEDAARIVLETIGRDAFTTAQIAAQAGVPIGSVYRYFNNRRAILDRLWPDRRDDIMPTIKEPG